jgi:hypothetical protein
LATLGSLLLPGARLGIVEGLARHTQRLSALVPESPEARAWSNAEESVYTDDSDHLTQWDAQRITHLLAAAGFTATVALKSTRSTLLVTEPIVQRWFADRAGSYKERLSQHAGAETVSHAERLVRAHLLGTEVAWTGAFCVALAQQ